MIYKTFGQMRPSSGDQLLSSDDNRTLCLS